MAFYSAYELIIESEINLSAVVSPPKSPDVVIKIAGLSHIDSHKINNDQSNTVLGNIPGVAKFLINNGREILVEPKQNIDCSVLSPCILGSAMAILLQQRGLLVLHASCVVIKEKGSKELRAIAFLGNSGDGKSTICSAFHNRGYSILTDDVMAIGIEENNIRVIPSIPEIKLRTDSANSMGYKAGTLSPLHPLTKKRVHKIESGFSHCSVTLKKIYLLDRGKKNQIQPLSSQNSFIELVKHTRAVKTLKSQNLEQAHFNKCAIIAEKIPMCRFIRKFTLSELPYLIDLVESDLNFYQRQ